MTLETCRAWPYPFWIAHRGAGIWAPENTLAAFKVGAQYGYRGFECDVKLSADGTAFLLHDATLERTTSGQGPACDRRWDELKTLDAGVWHSPAYAGEPLPTLHSVAHYCMAQDHMLNIELKPDGPRAYLTGQVVAKLVEQWWQDKVNKPLLSSFDPAALQGARQAAPSVPRALLLEQYTPQAGTLAQTLGCLAIVAHHPHLSTETIAQIHALGLCCVAYTVNDPMEVQRLMQAHIDALITDAVASFSPQII